MPCYHPITGYRSKYGKSANGSWPVVFKVTDGYIDKEVLIPCGQCIGCRLEHSRQWAIRCVHEAYCHDQNSFITLTYDNNHLSNTLNKQDFQKFMKRLRRAHDGTNKTANHRIRYFHAGEYGERFSRPHHHAAIFGYDFPDKSLWQTRGNVHLYRSTELENLWPFGYSSIGELTFESAAYVARYVTKKITGKKQERHYSGRLPEFSTQSRRPGIGREFLDLYQNDIYPLDQCIIRNNLKCRPPRYYDKIYDIENHHMLERIKYRRQHNINIENNTPERLLTRETLQQLKATKLLRSLESNKK